MGILMQISYFFPWINTGESRYNILRFLLQWFRSGDYVLVYRQIFSGGAEADAPDLKMAAEGFAAACIVITIIEIMSLFYLIIAGRGGYLTRLPKIAALSAMGLIMMLLSSTAISMIYIDDAENGMLVPGAVFGYLSLIMALECIWLIGGKAAEEWDETAGRVKEEKRKKKEYKKERKRRLYFPGRYSKLYYRILWKTVKYRRGDILFVFLSMILSELLLFTGISMRSIFSVSYGEDHGMLGMGLTYILKDFLVVIVLIELVLNILVLIFYRKKRMGDTGLFRILGIRSDAYFHAWIGEMAVCFVIAVLAGLVSGSIFLYVFCKAVSAVFPTIGVLGSPGVQSYFWSVLGFLIIWLFAFGISHDIHLERESADVRNTVVKGEKMPGKYRLLGGGICVLLAGYCMYRYGQRRTAESIVVLCAFLICLFGIIYNGWASWLEYRRKDAKTYLRTLVDMHMVRHRYQTSARYAAFLAAIHICALFFFMMTIVSNQISAAPENIFPYDYLFLACSSDEKYMDELRSRCAAEIYTFPMVRATTIDNTEELDPPKKIVSQQGQNIGVSETTYRKLKELAGEVPEEDLDLDENGQNIYIVYQQDQGAKAKPIDWYMMTKEPYLHIGQPLTAYDWYQYRDYYPQRHIAGEDTCSLTGCFSQGKYENMIVFSDAYFEKIKDDWKRINMYTGEAISEDEAVLEETVHEGPTMLTLVNVPEKYRAYADQIMAAFREGHAFDESFDPLVKSAYSKSEAVRQRRMERLLEITVGGFIWVMLLLVSILLLQMKIKVELPEMKERYIFMERLGMRKKERIRKEKREISRFVYVPLGLALPVSLIFTGITIRMRDFAVGDIIRYGKYALVLTGIYLLAQLANLKYLQCTCI